MKMFYITVAIFIMWLLIFHLCPRSTKKIEFFIGNLSFAFPFTNHEHNSKRNSIKIGEIIPNCGIEKPCPDNHFSIHVHTGRSISDHPKICVSGKYVIHNNLKNWARGFNIVLVDPRRKDSVAVVSFGNNVDLEEIEEFFSKDVQDDDIVIAMTFDEALAKLMNGFRKQFVDLGSGLIQNLQSRDQWYMVSQKGLEGFSPYEELLPFQRGRLDSLDRKFCIPTKIIGQAIVPDPMIQSNFKRKAFCQKHPQVEEFCSPKHILTELRPGFLLNPMMMGNPFYHSPILVLALHSLSYLSLTLETLLTQPGIQLKNVMVVYNPAVLEGVPELCGLFGMTSVKTGAMKYWEMINAGFEGLVKEHQESFYVTVLEEGVLLSPDYFSFISKTSQLLQDPSVLGVSAWNPNGFSQVSSRDDLVYRVESISWLAFTMKLSSYWLYLRPHLEQCCTRRSWEGWFFPDLDMEIIVPDVSRCFYLPDVETSGANVSASSLSASMFMRERRTSLNVSSEVKDIKSLHKDEYDDTLSAILESNDSRVLDISKEEILSFLEDETLWSLGSILKDEDRTFPLYVLPFIEGRPSSLEGMKTLCRCFGLFHNPESKPLGLYKHTLRFSISGVQFMLLSNLSTFFQISPYNNTKLLLP